MPSRRRFLAAAGSTFAASAVSSADEKPVPLFSFGLMADCQYADVPTAGARFYRESPRKLAEAVAAFNKRDLAFTLHLGDWIDREFSSFDDLERIAAKLKSKLHHALGNHDFDVPDELKAKVPGRLGLDPEQSYYSFRRDGFRFVVIDTTEVSTYRHAKDDPRTAAAEAERAKLAAGGARFAQRWNSRAGDGQVAWLEAELKAAADADEKALVFGHHPIMPVEGHCTWNQAALHELLSGHACCKAYLNGHNHAGGHADPDGLHYLTLDGMLDTKDQNAYAIAGLFTDRLEITGTGRQESRVLKFR